MAVAAVALLLALVLLAVLAFGPDIAGNAAKGTGESSGAPARLRPGP